MKLGIYSIKDTKIGFMNPFYQNNDEVALRTFKNACNDTQPTAANINPEDKELYKLGTFDDSTGEVIGKCEFMATAIECIVRTKPTTKRR